MGGHDSQSLSRQFQKYEWKDDRWRMLNGIGRSMEQIGLVRLNGQQLMMIGDRKIEVYDTESDRWMEWGSLKMDTKVMDVVMVDEQVYVLGKDGQI